MYVRRLVALVCACALALPLSGCASVGAITNPKPEVITEESTVAVVAADLVGELAPDAPTELPMWPGAQVESSEVVQGTYTVVLSASDPFDDVVNGIAAGMQRDGWDIVQEPSTSDAERSTVLVVAKNDTDGFITIAEGDDSTTIEYVLALAP